MASCRWGARSADAGLEEGMGTYLATRETLQGIPILLVAPVASSQFLEKFCFSIALGKLCAVTEANRSKMVEETKIGFVGHAQVSSYPVSRAILASGQVSWSTLLSREQNSCCRMTWRGVPWRSPGGVVTTHEPAEERASTGRMPSDRLKFLCCALARTSFGMSYHTNGELCPQEA